MDAEQVGWEYLKHTLIRRSHERVVGHLGIIRDKQAFHLSVLIRFCISFQGILKIIMNK